MSYPIEIKLANKRGWHTPAEAKAYYGRYSRVGVTVHWWNSKDKVKDTLAQHNTIVNYMLNRAVAGNGSVNYVLSNHKITMLVNPDNVAWASQSGNPTTVSVEFSPHLNAKGYKMAGWLIYQLEQRYKKGLKLYKHSHWIATQCPGTLDLNKMRSEANKWKLGGAYNPKPVPAPIPPKTAVIKWTKLPELTPYIINKNTNLWNFNSTTWAGIKAVAPFNKGARIEIYGMAVNETLNATYLLTEYSFSRKITNGFNRADMDLAPRPLPTPPPSEQPAPSNPPPPVEPTLEERVSALEKLVEWLKSLISKE